MVGWIKRQCRDIKGDAKWDAAKWLFALGWPTVLTLLATLVALFKGLNIATRVYILIPVVSFFVQAVIALVFRARRRSQINIKVTMDDGHSAYAGLTVTNLGEAHLFRAEGQIVASNRPPNYPKGMFRLGWSNHAKPSVDIPQYASERILLASFKDVTETHSLLEMSIWTIVGEESQAQWWARWLVKEDEDLPFFQLRVVVIAEGTRKPWEKNFLITPKSRLGPLSVKLAEESTV